MGFHCQSDVDEVKGREGWNGDIWLLSCIVSLVVVPNAPILDNMPSILSFLVFFFFHLEKSYHTQFVTYTSFFTQLTIRYYWQSMRATPKFNWKSIKINENFIPFFLFFHFQFQWREQYPFVAIWATCPMIK